MGRLTSTNKIRQLKTLPSPVVPATFDQVEEWKLFGGLDGEGGDGGGGGKSREAAETLSLLPRWDRKQLSHLQKRTRWVSCCSSVGAEVFKTIKLHLFYQENPAQPLENGLRLVRRFCTASGGGLPLLYMARVALIVAVPVPGSDRVGLMVR